MPYWVKLTAAGEKAKPLFVNLENVTFLEPRNYGTRIVFVGGEDRADVVEDSASDFDDEARRWPAWIIVIPSAPCIVTWDPSVIRKLI